MYEQCIDRLHLDRLHYSDCKNSNYVLYFLHYLIIFNSLHKKVRNKFSKGWKNTCIDCLAVKNTT